MQHEATTKEIIGAAFEVYNHLGYGFLEKVFKNAMKIELDLRGVPSILEAPIKVQFKGKIAGDYFADIFVAEKVLVELKRLRPTSLSRTRHLFLRRTMRGISAASAR